jgi:TPP-dependent 2-oxoacid decarboxylase
MDAITRPNIGEYLIQRLYDSGARHVFGVPGDYILTFYAMLTKSRLQVINTCDEQGAGFAADAYARLHGLGVVCVTYNVGGLKVVNTTAEAYAERSPVLVIAGAPGLQERQRCSLLHHKAKEYDDQFRIFERITVAATELRDPARAYQEVDRVLAEVLRRKGPGFIELPRDLITMVPEPVAGDPTVSATVAGESQVPPEALEQIVTRVNGAARPVILAGVELARHGLGPRVQALAERTHIPIVSTMLGKSAIDETSPVYLGIYAGVIEDERVREYVEASDCLLLLGVSLNDVNLGANTARLDPHRMISLSSDGCTIDTRSIGGAGIDAIEKLLEKPFLSHDLSSSPPALKTRIPPYAPADANLTAGRLFLALNAFLDDSMVLIADIGDAVMGSMGMMTRKPLQYLCPVYYSSLGCSVPAAIGARAARPDLRPVVVVGDGAFQMTGMEVSTAVRYGMNPIVVVLNNGGFGTERPMIDGPFNDVAAWKYHRIPDLIGSGRGYLVRTEGELDEALASARKSDGLALIEAILDPYDMTPQLRRMCEGLAKGVRR